MEAERKKRKRNLKKKKVIYPIFTNLESSHRLSDFLMKGSADGSQDHSEVLIDTRNLDIQPTTDPDEHSEIIYQGSDLEPKLVSSSRQAFSMIDSEFANPADKDTNYLQRYQMYEGKFAAHHIFLTEIHKILVNSSVLIILKENFEVIKFLRTDGKGGDLISLANLCQSNAKDVLNKHIEVVEVETLTDQINNIVQHFDSNSKFSSLVFLDEAYYLDSFNNMRKIFIRIDKESLHILKNNSTGIIISAYLKNLNYVYIYEILPLVKNHSELINIRLCFG